MRLRNEYEILAPAGSDESLAAAIRAGADAIYFGVDGLNMRARAANNFVLDDLKHIVRLCEKFGVRRYLAVNTIVYDGDLQLMRRIVDAARNEGVSAIIASDVAVMQYARNIGMEVHLSVQVNVTNIESLRFFSQFADVVVLARELNLEQVKYIHERILEERICGPSGMPVRIEMFCHGALCMAVSGKCYLSLHEYGASANRGDCYQVCRRGYTVKDRESDTELNIDNEYIMSPKDLKTIHFLNKLLDAGVSVLKIEGRARGADYVKTVVECYGEAVEAYCNNEYSQSKIEDWNSRLEKVFNRGFWNGYYLGQRLGEWNNQYGNKATEKKLYIGKVIKYFPKISVAEILVETNSLSKGDKMLITGASTGALTTVAEDIRVDDNPVENARKGERLSIKTQTKVRPSDKVFKLIV
ncbi:MAG: U32 family peptidase [Dysgonamonadaceae bacterium]|jgi:putative protease|nr:U32 family peptidase [Dysgonamonadaceae bacterium]